MSDFLPREIAMIVRLVFIFSFLCLIVFPREGHTQNQVTDSLKLRLAQVEVDTVAVDLLLDISFAYRNSSPDSTIHYAREGLIAAQEIKYLRGEVLALRNIGLGFQKKGEYDSCIAYVRKAIIKPGNKKVSTLGDAYNTLGTTFYFKGLYDSAIHYFEIGADIFKDFGEWGNQASNFANIGVISEDQGNYLKALEFYQQALSIFEREKNTGGIVGIKSNMGSILEDQGRLDEALEMYESVVAHDMKTNNFLGTAITLGAIAGIKEKKGNSEAAIADHRQALQMFIKAEANCRTGMALNNIGEIYLSRDELDSARHYFNEALEVARSCEIPENETTARLNMGDYFLKTNQPAEAETEFLKSYAIAEEMGLQPKISQASLQLYKTHKAKGDQKAALSYLEEHLNTFKAIYNEENARQIERIQAEYEFSKEKELFEHEKEVSDLRFENEISEERLKKNSLLIVLGVFLLLVTLLAVLYTNRVRTTRKMDAFNREILKQQEELHQLNKDLTELNDEKNTLIGIVAHDLKSPINQIRGLLQIMKLEGDTFSANMRQYLGLMDESSQRSVEMIERILDINAIENKKIEIKSEEVEISKLVKNAIIGFDPRAREKNIGIAYDAHETELKIYSDPLLLREIIDNLISNAIKFSPLDSTVQIRTDKIAHSFVVKIRDEGPGISEEDQQHMFNKYQQVTARPTANEKSTGLGLAIVKKYADELGYRIECLSNGTGTEFRLVMPQFERHPVETPDLLKS